MSVGRSFLHKILLPLVYSPIIGFFVAFVLMKFLFLLLAKISRVTINKWFSKLQIVSAAFMALSHGMNDAQKSMGIITLALISAGLLGSGAAIPVWVILACAAAMAAGTAMGGKKIIKTIGSHMMKIDCPQGFAAETSSAFVITAMSIAGNPISTTQVITAGIMGSGSAKRASAVRWGVVRNILSAWVFTLPAAAILGGAATLLVKIATGTL